MKQLSTVMTAAIAGAVLAGSLGLGLGIRSVRTRNTTDENPAQVQTQQAQKPAVVQADAQPRPANRDGGGRAMGDGGMGIAPGDRAGMQERWENMSEEERAKFRDEMRSRFSGGGGGGRGDTGGMRQRRPQLSPEVQARVEELRSSMETMSEEEQAKARAEIMQLTGGGRGGSGRRGGNPDDMVFRGMEQAEADELREKWPDMTDEERQPYRDQARQRFEEMRQQGGGFGGGGGGN